MAAVFTGEVSLLLDIAAHEVEQYGREIVETVRAVAVSLTPGESAFSAMSTSCCTPKAGSARYHGRC